MVRVSEELWTEVRDTVQEAVIKTITKKNKQKEATRLSEEALQIAEKRRQAKGKRVKERYIHLNTELQRIARRDKKDFLSDQCKEIEENNRIGKTRELVHPSTLAWKIPWMEEPGRLQSMGLQRVGQD